MKRDYKENLDEILREADFSGVVSIHKDNKTIYENAVGFADRVNCRPNNMETKFGIASGTKTFTALGIFRLVDMGLITLETKVFDILDLDFPTYNKEVTVFQLLMHRSGLPDYFDEEEVEDFDNFTVDKPWSEMFDPSDYFEVFPDKPMKSEPGEKFSYNNSGFVLLAGLIAKVSGMRYIDFVKKEVLNRAGMMDSGFYSFNQLPKNTANGYIDMEDGSYRTNIYNLPIVGCGDGGAFTTALDMEVFWDRLLKGEIVSNDLVELMLRPASKVGDKGDYYGCGIWLRGGEDKKVADAYFLEGCDAGVSFTSYYDRKSGAFFTVISNTTDGAWDIVEKVKAVLR